ncbi:hypothetical protein DPMN_100679 [Dreissena polymorpha]|uniref:Uncharacterized protein n=1 Tax=Dreissena polymorpha TaxID=45954 RepID=A0A9D4R9D5_DREPO|nr:hypothetical protein DPMN_100679 [Dreissena polymorpha]
MTINSTSGVKVPQSAGAEKSQTCGDLPPETSLAYGEPMDDVPPTEPTKPMISVSDKFPKSIQARRKILLTVMVSAKKDGKAAYLSYDKLYIDNRMYTVDTVHKADYSIS